MQDGELNVVTGAFSYTGKYIAQRLLSIGKKVITLTNRVDREDVFGHQVQALSFNFDKPRKLADSLRGATTMYNTYWVRFPYGQVSFDKAVENSKTLIKAAEESGIRRIVHISITNPSEDSPLPLFQRESARGKGYHPIKVILRNNPTGCNLWAGGYSD